MSKIKEAIELSIDLNQKSGGWSHHRELFYAAKDELEALEQQRDTAWRELREIREVIKADENESTADEVRSLLGKYLTAKRTLEDHGPEGHNVTNQQFVELRGKWDELRARLAALEEIATAVEADIDCGRPLEYNVEELRTELIRARNALGILPEQKQEKETPYVD